MRSLRPLAATLLAILAAAAIFGLWPGLDLAVARALRGPEGFIGRTPFTETLRSVFFAIPYLWLAAAGAAWAAGRIGALAPVPGRAILFLFATLAAGPGLLVNLGLKEHSGRPRPTQIVEFGGTAEFRPFWRFDGACEKNCSFVSGEAAAAAWTLGPALLVPPPARGAAVVAALVFTAAVSALRLSFGGHFLSDVAFAALFTWAIVLATARAFRLPRARGAEDLPS